MNVGLNTQKHCATFSCKITICNYETKGRVIFRNRIREGTASADIRQKSAVYRNFVKKNKLTTSISSEAQKNHGWKNGQRELGSRCSVIIKKKTKSQNLYENLIFVSFETEPTDRRTK